MVLSKIACALAVALLIGGGGRTAVAKQLIMAECPATLHSPVEIKELRRALVVGNVHYGTGDQTDPDSFTGIPAATNDGDGMAEALCKLGFRVRHVRDLTRDELVAELRELGEVNRLAAKDGRDELRLFYYSGHGVQIENVNQVVTIGANATSLLSNVVSFNTIYDALRAGEDDSPRPRRVAKVLLFDACRTLTISNKFVADPLGQPGGGLTDALIGFAASFGRISQATPDTKTGRSPWTEALLHRILMPGLTSSQLLNWVRGEVQRVTQGAQSPWDSNAIKRELFFAPPLYITIDVDRADDSVSVDFNKSTVVNAQARPARTVVSPGLVVEGNNDISLRVYNQKTYRNGQAVRLEGLIPKPGIKEGWNYTVRLDVIGYGSFNFVGSETESPDDRWGKTFDTQKAEINVNPETGAVTFSCGDSLPDLTNCMIRQTAK